MLGKNKNSGKKGKNNKNKKNKNNSPNNNISSNIINLEEKDEYQVGGSMVIFLFYQ